MRRLQCTTLLAPAVFSACSLMWIGAPLAAQTAPDASSAIKVDLKTTLEKGLRCRRPQEFAYVAQVVEMVDSGELPEALVRNLYGWARRRGRYPLQAFQVALNRQAARLGIEDVPVIENNTASLTGAR